jgi:hypothetical protein
VDPELRSVTIYRGPEQLQTLENGDTLDGAEILPGFRCPVSALLP